MLESQLKELYGEIQWRIYGGVRGGQDPPTSHESAPHLQGPPRTLFITNVKFRT